MSVRIITYDLNKEPNSEAYKEILKIIKSYAFAKLSESSYAIETDETPLNLYEKLKPYLDNNDCLLVLKLTKPYYGQHKQEVLDWLREKL